MVKPTIIIAIFFISYSACRNREHHKKYIQDEFYSITGGWDWERVPLLKPYEIIKADPEIKTNPWTIRFFTTLGTYNVRRVDVKDSIIYILSGKIDGTGDSTLVNLRNVLTGWYVINVNRKTEDGFASEIEFESFIRSKKYKSPQWHDVDSLSNALANGNSVPWIPK